MTIFYGGKVNVYDDVPGDKVTESSFSYEKLCSIYHDELAL